MILPARNIWDTAIQCVCAAVTAVEDGRAEIYLCANFGQVSLDPPRLIINPNKLYPMEGIIRRTGRFAINVFRADQRDEAIRLSRLRRREADKAGVLGWKLEVDGHGIPYLADCLGTLFCEVERILETGDHTVMICRVLESRPHGGAGGDVPLLYPEISGRPSRFPLLAGMARGFLRITGAKDMLIRLLRRWRPKSPPDLAANTYQGGGQTEEEVAEIVRHGLIDSGRIILPPARGPAVLQRRLGLCVVGVGAWGSYHARLFREASPLVDLYVCGRRPERLAAVARAAGAKDIVVGFERALEDKRFQALSLALPHDLHAWAAQAAASRGKHVLVEKPIATSLEDADRMIETARSAGTILMVAEDMHFRPAVREAVRAISAGDIGEPLYMLASGGGFVKPEGWKADGSRLGGGVLMDMGVHYVRALRLLMGEPDRVLATKAMQVNTKMTGDDSAEVLFSSGIGWRAHVLLSWATIRGHGPDIVVAGERGTLQLWPGASYIDFFPSEPGLLSRLLSYVRPAWIADKLRRPGLERIRRPIPGQDRQGYLSEAREFLAAVAEERVPVTPASDARRDLELVLFSYESLRTEAWTRITRP